MSERSERLIKRLARRGVTVLPLGNTAIVRDVNQEVLNRNAGECAPTWYLADNVLAHHSGRVIDIGNRRPNFEFEGEHFDGEHFSIGSYMPVTHLLSVPIDQLHLLLDRHHSRLEIDADYPPDGWT